MLPKQAPREHQCQGETILLVEDEISLLNMGEIMLRELGYSVLAASSPHEALHLAPAHIKDRFADN